MPACCVKHCRNRSERGKSMYRIPSGQRDIERRATWLLRMDRRTAAPMGIRVCEDHFEDDQFEDHLVNGKRRLKPDAVPSIFRNHEGLICKSLSGTSEADEAVPRDDVPQVASDLQENDNLPHILEEASEVVVEMTEDATCEISPPGSPTSCDPPPETLETTGDLSLLGASGTTIVVLTRTKAQRSSREEMLETMLEMERKKRKIVEEERDKLLSMLQHVLAQKAMVIHVQRS